MNHRRSTRGQWRHQGTKRNSNWKPSGRDARYMETYVTAILAGDRAQVHMCLSKDRHPSQESAHRAIAKLEARVGGQLRAYACPYCNGYHLTSKPKATEATAPAAA